MGGYNSGRPQTHSAYLGSLLPFMLKGVNAHLRTVGASAVVSWSNGSKAMLEVCDGYLRVTFASNGENYSREILLAFVPLKFGGERAYMRCRCGRRVSKLYMVQGLHLVCRTCTGYTYRSKSQTEDARLLDTIHKLQARIDPEAARSADIWEIPERPPGMRTTTYQRLANKLGVAIRKRDQVLDVMLTRAMERMGMGENPPDKNRFWA